jgi:hypothetical protein
MYSSRDSHVFYFPFMAEIATTDVTYPRSTVAQSFRILCQIQSVLKVRAVTGFVMIMARNA